MSKPRNLDVSEAGTTVVLKGREVVVHPLTIRKARLFAKSLADMDPIEQLAAAEQLAGELVPSLSVDEVGSLTAAQIRALFDIATGKTPGSPRLSLVEGARR